MPTASPLSADPRLLAYRRTWEEKPVLREIYAAYHRQLAAWLLPGATLELGGGSGNLKAMAPGVITTDILPAPWLDAVADAHHLPFAGETFANLVLFDVLHHLSRPRLFFAEVERVLRPGGRLLLIEPMITPVSGVFYRWFHPEPVAMGVDPLQEAPLWPPGDPYAANQAIPTLIWGGYRSAWQAAFPALRLRTLEPMAFLAYPLSGGFRPWTLLPAALVPWLLRLETGLAPWLGRLAAFRMLVVVEKAAPPVARS